MRRRTSSSPCCVVCLSMSHMRIWEALHLHLPDRQHQPQPAALALVGLVPLHVQSPHPTSRYLALPRMVSFGTGRTLERRLTEYLAGDQAEDLSEHLLLLRIRILMETVSVVKMGQ